MKEYQAAFERLKRDRSSEPSWLRDLRAEAMASLGRKRFPTLKDEAWRYTDIAPLRDAAWMPCENIPEPSPATVEALKKKSGPNFLLVVNGKFSRKHSAFEKGVEVMGLEEAILSNPGLEKSYRGGFKAEDSDAFSALNAGFSKYGLLIRVLEGVTLKEPLHIIFLAQPRKDREALFVRSLIVMEKKSKAAILESYVAEGGKTYLTNAVTEISLGEGSALEHSKIQAEHPDAFHIAMTQVAQRHGSSFVSFALSIGSKLMRNDCRISLTEPGASCALNGLYLGDKDQVLDHQTFVDHEKPDGKSDQFFKGLLAGNSRGVFSGRVIVRQDAQRTNAHQTNKNLLLSDGAKVDTLPQLEILADDVKCSHGAAVGQLQEDALFYLRSRGIGENEASRMLAEGFAREVIEHSGLDVFKTVLVELVNKKLTQQLYGRKG